MTCNLVRHFPENVVFFSSFPFPFPLGCKSVPLPGKAPSPSSILHILFQVKVHRISSLLSTFCFVSSLSLFLSQIYHGLFAGSWLKVMASKTKIYIVLELVTGGELFDKIAIKGRLKEDEARKYFQ
ncbi:hypothetical protein PVK06_038896 [Gossypium arboreum]|uniref:Uncharacterized protein n=1 Tax=Gossypium arboreum TaxID=29729 RepID=A0ABR0N1E9_GOSAR|nr:hypothetical protein PVK06_038896 [Gossypium arboreum]